MWLFRVLYAGGSVLLGMDELSSMNGEVILLLLLCVALRAMRDGEGREDRNNPSFGLLFEILCGFRLVLLSC